MASSPSHKFGQIIGDLLEDSIVSVLQEFADEHHLYLDKKGIRPARSGTKVTWVDADDNKHDLDFVLERGGSPTKRGKPAAFIESAWRSYTKHSRNKAQEIQSAIEPLAATYEHLHPFKGVILAGVFTEGALTQLRSRGFKILFFPQETFIAACRAITGIDAYFGEKTPDEEIEEKIQMWERLSEDQKKSVGKAWVTANTNKVQSFIKDLTESITRSIKSISVLPLYGRSFSLDTLEEAIEFVKNYSEMGGEQDLIRYEVRIVFTDGTVIDGKFPYREKAIEFLSAYRTPLQKSVEHIMQNEILDGR
jgi:hypothetical protein